MTTRRRREKNVDQIEGKFVCGWAEYLPPAKEEIHDAKGRLVKCYNRPGKIVTRLMVELDDGSCVPINGEHFEPLSEGAIKGSMIAAFPGKLKEVNGIAAKAYKKGATVRIRRTIFKDNGYTTYLEIDE